MGTWTTEHDAEISIRKTNTMIENNLVAVTVNVFFGVRSRKRKWPTEGRFRRKDTEDRHKNGIN